MKWTPSNFEASLVPFTIANRLMGLRVFECPRGRPRRLLSLFYVLMLLSIHRQGKAAEGVIAEQPNTYLLELLWFKTMRELKTFSIFNSIFTGWYFSKSFNVFKVRMTRIDETLKLLGIVPDYQKTLYTCYKMLFCAALMLSVIATTHLSWLKSLCQDCDITIIGIMFCYSFFVEETLTFDFAVCVKSIGIRFQAVNELLTSLASGTSSSGSVNGNGASYMIEKLNAWRVSTVQPRSDNGEIKRAIRTLKQVHLELGRVSTMLCNIYRMQITMEMCVAVTFLIGIVYSIYCKVAKDNTNLTTLLCYLIGPCGWCMAYTIRIIILNSPCEQTANEADRTSTLIHAFHGLPIDVDLRNEIYQFALQIALRPVKFSIFGLPLNYALVRSCFGRVATYALIMIQLGNEETLVRH